MSSVSADPNTEGRVPAGYRQVLYWRVAEKRWRSPFMLILGALSLIPWWTAFGWFGRSVGRMPPAGRVGALEFVLALFGTPIAVMALHEAAHALAMRLCGARPQFGVMYLGLLAYAAAPGHAFTRAQYAPVGLAPLVGLSLLCVLGMYLLAGSAWVGLLVLAATLNAAGAIGDLWMLGVIVRYPPDALLIDERDGMRVLLPD